MVKFGIIGCGRIAQRFGQGIKAMADAEITAVYSRRRDSVDAFVAEYGGQPYDCAEELLASDINAVYIATLPDSHAAYSMAALKAGKHVLCEKPATINLKQLGEVLAVANETGLLFMEGMKPPFYPLYQKLKGHLTADPIGDIGYVRAGSSVADIEPSHPNFSYDLIGGSLMQIGIYEAFLAIDWMGNVKQVQTMGRFNGTQLDMFSVFQTLHEHGGYAQLYSGFDVHGHGDALICGTLGNVIIHKNWWNPAKATVNYLDGRVVELDEPFADGGLNYEIEHFCNLIRSGVTESPVISHEMSRQMIGMIDEARRQVGLKYPGE